jgi:predicted AAA+ superfamily ATPase
MSPDDLMQIAETWSFWSRPVPPSVPRSVALPAALSERRALVVQGVRRCGKSVLLRQMVARYGLDPSRCLFVNFEDPRLAGELDWQVLEALVEGFSARTEGDAPRTYFLDEIQGVRGWERWLRTRLEQRHGDRYVVTGSNGQLLAGELGTALTGRHQTVELFPFDLEELRRLRSGVTLSDYLHGGGFPEPVELGGADGDDLLRQYLHDIVERDVRERLGARSSRPLRQVVQLAYEAAGSELSARRLASVVGVAPDTASSYLSALEDAYLLFSVPFFAYSERRRRARNVKVYPVDTGLRRVVARPGSADRGKALECVTYLALRRHFDDVSYWRGKGEVDFVVRRGSWVVPIQVSWGPPQPRHHRALEAFYEAHPNAQEAVFVDAEGFEEAVAQLAAS